MKIFKYELMATDEQTIAVKKGAVIMSVGVQKQMPVLGEDESPTWRHSPGERIVLWAAVDELAQSEYRTIFIRGTGHELNFGAEAKFIGTVQTHDGALVWHVFEKVEP